MEQIIRKLNRLSIHKIDHLCKNWCAKCVDTWIGNSVCPDEGCDFIQKSVKTIIIKEPVGIPVGHIIHRNEIRPHTVGRIVQYKKPPKNFIGETFNVLILHIVPEIGQINQVFKGLIIL